MRFELDPSGQFYTLCAERAGKETLEESEALDYLEVPESHEGVRVEEIGERAFACYPDLKVIRIGAGIKSISPMAFVGCESLREIQVVSGNTSYKSVDGCLYTRDGKTLVAYPAGIEAESFYMPDYVSEVSPYAFYENKKLTTLSISHTATKIGEKAFYGCSSLKKVELPKRVASVGAYAFANCDGLTEVKACGLKESGVGVFEGCTSLTAVYFTEDSQTVGEAMFKGCTSLQLAMIKADVIKNNAFEGCGALSAVVISASVREIGEWAFYGCSTLKNTVIPNSVKRIGEHAFCGCREAKFYVCHAKKPKGWSDIWNSSDREVAWTDKCYQVDLTASCIREGIHRYANGVCRECGAKMPLLNRLKYKLEGNQYEVVGKCIVSSTEITIPVEHKGKPVRNVGTLAFNGSSMKRLCIPRGVSVSYRAACGMPNLIVAHEESIDYRSIDCYNRKYEEYGKSVAPLSLHSTENEQESVGYKHVTAPLPGYITKVNYQVGDYVRQGDVVLVVEAMKMENEILAPVGGVICKMDVQVGAAVDTYQSLFAVKEK